MTNKEWMVLATVALTVAKQRMRYVSSKLQKSDPNKNNLDQTADYVESIIDQRPELTQKE